jgi:CheY-like chemotaxis protein
MIPDHEPAGEILVVDDNEANRYTVVRLLRKAGFHVQEATDGRRGLAAAHPDHDLIILDIRMPEMDGYEVCRRLKADPALRAIPILHISATYTSTRDIATGLEGGADGYLTHPVDPEVLLGTVRAFLRLRRTDRALRESESRARARAEELEALMAAAPVAVMIAHDPECRRITANPAGYQLFRMEAGSSRSLTASADQQPTHFRVWREGRGLEPHELPLQVAAATGSPAEAEELELEFADGTRRYVSGTATPLFDADGHVRGAIGAFIDVTEQRHVRAQLERAQRMEAVGRLAGGFAHETNNQMAVVLGLADYVLQAGNLNADQRRDLQQMRHAADRVAQLTRQLLALSRRQILHAEPVELDRLLRETHGVLSRLLGPDYPIRLALDAAGEWVRVDRTQLIQVLLNLTVNARDAMPGGGHLTIATSRGPRPAEGGRLGRHWTGEEPPALLAVSDTGGGIDPAISGRIFEPFFTTKPVGEGTGLGLSVVEGIVAQSAGELWVDSSPQAGTTITIALPVVAPPGSPGERAPPPVAGGHERLLVVDDEPGVRAMLVRQLGARGYDVVAAEGGAEALELLRSSRGQIALVISDVVMPAMSGPELARRARMVAGEIPFIFISGQPREALTGSGDPGEFGPVIEKPFTAEELASAVRRTLDRQERASASPVTNLQPS